MRRMLTLRFDGRSVQVPEGAHLVALLDGDLTCHRSVRGEPRGPLCGMGVCQECRLNVNGRLVLACRTLAQEGMEVRRG